MVNVDGCLQTRSQIEVVASEAELALGTLVNIQTPADFDHPAVVQSQVSVVQSL